MTNQTKLGFLIAVMVLLAMAVTMWAANGTRPGSAPNAERPTSYPLAKFDIYRTGIPNYQLVWDFCTTFDFGKLQHLPRSGAPRPDGYYWVLLDEEERHIMPKVVEELQRIMGKDFPIAVSLVRFCKPDEATERAWLEDFKKRMAKTDIYRSGTPDFDLVMKSYRQLNDVITAMYPDGTVLQSVGIRVDGYYHVMVRQENWDVIRAIVAQIQKMTGEDFPISVSVGEVRPLGDVFGGRPCAITFFSLPDWQTLGFAAVMCSVVGMVLWRHWWAQWRMPVRSRVLTRVGPSSPYQWDRSYSPRRR